MDRSLMGRNDTQNQRRMQSCEAETTPMRGVLGLRPEQSE
jgi:hypothetical protein